MKHDRDFWTLHVEGWRSSGLTQKAYCKRHRLSKGSLGYWSSTLSHSIEVKAALVEVGRAEVQEKRPSSPIEVVVEGWYLLRLWPGVEPAHIHEVLSVLEQRR